MLDIAYIRENKDLVELKSRQKGLPVDINKLLELDEEHRQLLAQVEDLRRKRNELSSSAKGQAPSPSQIDEGKQLKIELAEREKYLSQTEAEFERLLKTVPNMPASDVPVGETPQQNVVTKEWGEKPKFDFNPKTHWELGEARGLIDKTTAARVAGARFAYLKGELVKLQFGIVSWALNVLTDQRKLEEITASNGLKASPKPFMPVLPPYMLKTAVFEAMDRLEPRDDRYKVGEDQDDLWLQGSAEHVMGPIHMDEILTENDLPLRYIGYATSFRREAGSYGKDTEGIIRMHQFDKLEMESFSSPASGPDEHLLMIAVQEYFMQQLGLPYRVINKCTADIGKPNARGVDIEVWMPGQDRYLETHTADYMSDYQARRLKTRIKTEGAKMELAHTNDATAFALGRTLAAIIENYQTKDSKVKIPEVLKPFMGQDQI